MAVEPTPAQRDAVWAFLRRATYEGDRAYVEIGQLFGAFRRDRIENGFPADVPISTFARLVASAGYRGVHRGNGKRVFAGLNLTRKYLR